MTRKCVVDSVVYGIWWRCLKTETGFCDCPKIGSCWNRTCTNTCSPDHIKQQGLCGLFKLWFCLGTYINQQSNFWFLQGNAGRLKLAVDDFRSRALCWSNPNGQTRPCWNWDEHDAGKYGHYKPNGLRVHLQHRGGYLCGANCAGACNALTESALELLALRYARGQDHLVEMRKNNALLAPAHLCWLCWNGHWAVNFRVCILMNPQLVSLYCNDSDYSSAPPGSVSTSAPLGGFRLEDSAALSSQGRSLCANQVTNQAFSCGDTLVSHFISLHGFFWAGRHRWSQWIDMDRRIECQSYTSYSSAISTYFNNTTYVDGAGLAICSARARWHPHHLLQRSPEDLRMEFRPHTNYPYLSIIDFSCTVRKNTHKCRLI